MKLISTVLALAATAGTVAAIELCKAGITGFTLMDAVNNAEIGPLTDFGYDDYPAINIRADFEECGSTGSIKSVQFLFDGEFHRCENYVPYALDGDNNPTEIDLALNETAAYYPSNISIGEHTITAMPYNRKNCKGDTECPLSQTFHVRCSGCPAFSCPGKITGFTLIDAAANVAIAPLSDFYYDNLTTRALNIRADYEECSEGTIKSVQFYYDNGAPHRCENFAPYALDGDFDPIGNYFDSSISVGEHTIVAVPWDGSDCTGNPGSLLSQTFQVGFEGCPGYVSGFVLWFSVGFYLSKRPWQSIITTLSNGDVVCRKDARGELAIQAETVSCGGATPVASVVFGGDFSGTDSSENYFVPSDLQLPGGLNWIKGQEFNRRGVYTVSATPYSADGEEGVGMSVSFEIAKC